MSQARSRALLAVDYNREVAALNRAIEDVNQQRAEAEGDIGFWDTVGTIGGAIVGAVVGSTVGQPLVGARIGSELGGTAAGQTADYFIDENELTLYDEINQDNFKFDVTKLSEYEMDYHRMNEASDLANQQEWANTFVNIGTTLLVDHADNEGNSFLSQYLPDWFAPVEDEVTDV
jgi:hypothetical protein